MVPVRLKKLVVEAVAAKRFVDVVFVPVAFVNVNV